MPHVYDVLTMQMVAPLRGLHHHVGLNPPCLAASRVEGGAPKHPPPPPPPPIACTHTHRVRERERMNRSAGPRVLAGPEMRALLAGTTRLLDAVLAVQEGGASLLEALLHPESGQPGMWSRAAWAAGTSAPVWLDRRHST